MRNCYWGWETRGNRIAWCLVVTFVLLGAAFWIPGVVGFKRCVTSYSTCRCKATADGWVCLNPAIPSETARFEECKAQHTECLRRPVAVWGVGWFFLVICSWIPCCYFCCCSTNPKGSSSNAYTPGVQMGAMPAQPYSPYAGPPVAAFPGSYPQAAQPTAAATAYQPAYPTYTQNPYDSNVPVHRY